MSSCMTKKLNDHHFNSILKSILDSSFFEGRVQCSSVKKCKQTALHFSQQHVGRETAKVKGHYLHAGDLGRHCEELGWL